MRLTLPRFLSFALALVALALAFFPRAALAAGTVKAEKTTLTEADGRWRLKLNIDYGSVPDLAYVPMIFDFEPVTYYERALTDESPEKPVLNKKPLQNMKHINESMEVGFSDGTGKSFKVTKFDFAIRRDRGFEAGEYKLIVKLSDSGKQLGQPIRLILEGDNPVVDRRAISFVGEKADDKKGKPKSKHAEGPDTAKADGASEPEPGPVSDGTPEPAAEPPAPVEPKQGGCGCEVPGGVSAGPSALLSLAGVAAVALRRRRRRDQVAPNA
ncbi:MAG: hypothetical protein JNL21_23045 [Myxococcales bacterium]|nr:hypothetical protein [Myxococcales bacterium]